MSESSEAYFENLATHADQPLLHHVTGTMRFEIEQKNSDPQKWCVTINQGEVNVRRGSGEPSGPNYTDCIISGPEDEFQNILNGRDSFAAAFVRGAITVQGDHTLAQNLRRFSPPAEIEDDASSDHRAGNSKSKQGKNHSVRHAPFR